MRKIVITLLLLNVLLLNAQTLLVTGENSIFTSDPCLTTNAYLDVKNISSQTLEIKCEKNIISQPAGTSNYFCWGGTCYSPNQSISSASLVLQSGEGNDNSFGGYFDAFCAIESANVEYCFYPISDPSDRTCVTVTYNSSTTNVLEEVFGLNNFFPNPTSEATIRVNYKARENSYLKFIDILGAEVKSIKLSNLGSQSINIGELSKGIYFGNLVCNDKIIDIKKLIIN